MKKFPLYSILFLFPVVLTMVPGRSAAEIALRRDIPLFTAAGSIPDSVAVEQPSQQDEKQDKNKKRDQKPEVKEVPKSRRQPKPAAVKPKVKIKTPVKKIKPVIKKPLGLVHKSLGI